MLRTQPTTGTHFKLSFNTMKTFHLLTLQSQITAQDYFEYLNRNTNGVAPHEHQVRYVTMKPGTEN